MMRHLIVAAAAIVSTSAAASSPAPRPAAASLQQREVVRGYLMPFKCQNDEKVSHTRDCALRPECEITGYGIALDDGTFLQFDAESNRKAAELLKATTQTNDLKAEAEGERTGALFRAHTIKLSKNS
jgi:hypothetical protein